MQTRKRKKKAESVIYTFKDADKEDYADIKAAWKTKEDSEYNIIELIKRKADELAERFHKEADHSYSECDFPGGKECDINHKISTEIREHFKPSGDVMHDENEGLRNYISHILGTYQGGYKGGIYTRKYDKKTIQEDHSVTTPYDDTNAEYKRLSDAVDQIHYADKFAISRRGRTDLTTRLHEAHKKYKAECDKDKIPFSNNEKDSLDDKISSNKKSLEALPEEHADKRREEILGAKLFKLRDIFNKIGHDVIDRHYLSDDPKIQEDYIKWLDAWITFYKPIADSRYTGDWRDWLQPIIDKVLNDNSDPGSSSSDRVDSYKIYYDGTVKSKIPFTKKHVAGDGIVSIVNKVIKIRSNIECGRGLFDNYGDTKLKQTKKRKKDLHPTLSDA